MTICSHSCPSPNSAGKGAFFASMSISISDANSCNVTISGRLFVTLRPETNFPAVWIPTLRAIKTQKRLPR